MKRIYHLITPHEWQQLPPGPYQAASLRSEGFIHCSYAEQVAGVANQFFTHEPELLVLGIDTRQAGSPVRAEDIGTGERFPHVYGPIAREAIVAVDELKRDAESRWTFAAGEEHSR